MITCDVQVNVNKRECIVIKLAVWGYPSYSGGLTEIFDNKNGSAETTRFGGCWDGGGYFRFMNKGPPH